MFATVNEYIINWRNDKMEEKKHHEKEDTLTLKVEDIWKSISVILFILLIVSIFTGGFGFGSNDNNPTIVQKQKTIEKPTAVKLTVDGFAAKGAEDAKVTIVEYSSFSCGYCNRVRGTLDKILETYPDDVKIVYKHFNRGGTDIKTAQATECANDQGKFWEMHDAIFDGGSSGDLSAYAKSIGLDVTEFEDCLSSEKYKEKVGQSTAEARSLGVGGTPSFFVNGKSVEGAQPFENFKKVIDAALVE